MTGSAILVRAGRGDLAEADMVMAEAFDPCFGEAWSPAQLAAVLPLSGVWLTIARIADRPVGFSLLRNIIDEAELLLLAVSPDARGAGLGRRLIERGCSEAQAAGARRVHLEVRADNAAVALYRAAGFLPVGRRRDYYRGAGGRLSDAITLARTLAGDAAG